MFMVSRPIYWYPSAYGRSLRSALAPSYYESSEWPRLYSNTIDDDNDDSENPGRTIEILFFHLIIEFFF
jgi:hypothetical protein